MVLCSGKSPENLCILSLAKAYLGFVGRGLVGIHDGGVVGKFPCRLCLNFVVLLCLSGWFL